MAEKLDENRDRIDLEPLWVIGKQTYMIAINKYTHKFYLNVFIVSFLSTSLI